MEVRLTDKSSGAHLGMISREDFQFLVDHLEEESSRDSDYFIDQATVEILADAGASAALVALLRGAVGNTDGVDIGWAEV